MLRSERYRLQASAACLLPNHRVSKCCRALLPNAPGVTVYATTAGKAVFGNLLTCGSPWACPVCASRIAERRRVEIADAVVAHRAAGGLFSWLRLPCVTIALMRSTLY